MNIFNVKLYRQEFYVSDGTSLSEICSFICLIENCFFYQTEFIILLNYKINSMSLTGRHSSSSHIYLSYHPFVCLINQ